MLLLKWIVLFKFQNSEKLIDEKRKFWARAIHFAKRHSAIDDGDSVLEIGCGPVGIFTILKDHKMVCIDPNINRYERYIKTFQKSDYPEVSFVKTTIEQYQPAEQFPMVFCMDVVNYSHDIDIFLSKTAACIEKDGYLLLTFRFVKNNFRSRFLNRLRFFRQRDIKRSFDYYIGRFISLGFLIHAETPINETMIYKEYLLLVKKQV